MKIKFILSFLVLIAFETCGNIDKENEDDSKLLYSLILLPYPPDRAENYDRDVKIITHRGQEFPIPCDPSNSDEDLNFFIELLKMEISRYPRGYWIKAGVEYVQLCRNFDGGSMDLVSNIMYLNVLDEIGKRRIYDSETSTFISPLDYYARLGTIHHELTHAVDKSLGFILFDPAWGSLNYAGFQYGNHYGPQQNNPHPQVFSHPLPGFVSLYATTNHVEDRAEIGQGIMGPISDYNRLIRFCQSDPIIAAKVNRTISEWKEFWPFPGAENSDWKTKITATESACNGR
ncbi:LIC13305 family lipoprotein [Leptospira mayottensis]|uniref:LIC13305 family lipoprotein n=1 Tax=Leptospira mayottensis TaxID=1137606 RepID=UPI0002BF34B2|nr:hypothetical protein [Leptospira mayottensis]AXR60989.1 hypothetical protein DQM68_10115 [Leptospira mayottensis]AZQ02577.1 hypothetical protein LEP1GSC190_11570 [Leptospira mayottensis 200901116]TGM96837.1 hypothetical protein EHR03_15120 [Leptospira mayottensis]